MLLIKLFLTEKVCNALNKRVFRRKGKNGVDRVGVLSIEGRGGGVSKSAMGISKSAVKISNHSKQNFLNIFQY